MGNPYGSAEAAAMGRLEMRRQTSAYGDRRNGGLIRDELEDGHEVVREAAQKQEVRPGSVAGTGMEPVAGGAPGDWKPSGFEEELKARPWVA